MFCWTTVGTLERMCQETEQSAYLAVWFWILINFRILPENHGNVLQSFVAS